MAALGIVAALAAQLVVGVAVVRALGAGPRTDRLAFWGWAWLCGALLVALCGLGWLAAGKPFDGTLLAPLALLGGAAALVAVRRRPVLDDPPPRGSMGPAFLALVAVLVVVVLDAGSYACLSPILVGDEANIWAAKAKALLTADGLGLPFALEATFVPVEHADYPLLVPLLHVWIHAAAGGLEPVAPRLPLIGVQVAFVLVLASALGRGATPWIAALLLVAVLGHAAPMRLFGDAGADIPVACGLLCGVECWRRWVRTRAFAHGALSVVALTFTAWAKNEGLMLVLVATAAIAVAAVVGRPRERVLARPSAGWWIAAVPVVVLGVQRALAGWWGFPNDLFAVSGHDGSTVLERVARAPERVGEVLGFFVRDVLLRTGPHEQLALGPTRLLLPLAWAAFLIAPARGRRVGILVPMLVSVGGVAAYSLVFLITPHELDWHLVTAAQRISFHVVPLAALALGAMLSSGRGDGAAEPAA